MIAPEHPLPLARQCRLLELARSTFYYKKKPLPERDLKMMRHIDEIHLAWPFYGSRRIMHELRGRGYRVGRGHVSRLMKIMGIHAIYRRSRTGLAPFLLTPQLVAAVISAASSVSLSILSYSAGLL
ncbi:MAG: transposase [Actinobacteria bacterium]|nr:transposase [Actinomycetota bacterium]